MNFSRPGVVLCGVLAVAIALAAPLNGQRTSDDVLAHIFSKFCVGK